MTELDKAVCRYVTQQTKGKSPDQIVEFFVRKLIFENGEWLERVVKEQHWANDILKIANRMAQV